MNRPYSRVLIGLLLLFAAAQALNAMRSTTLPAEVALLPAFEFVASGMWTLVFLWAAVRLSRAVPLAHTHAVLLLFAFAGYNVVHMIVFARADYDRQRIPFLLVALVIGLLLIGLSRIRR